VENQRRVGGFEKKRPRGKNGKPADGTFIKKHRNEPSSDQFRQTGSGKKMVHKYRDQKHLSPTWRREGGRRDSEKSRKKKKGGRGGGGKKQNGKEADQNQWGGPAKKAKPTPQQKHSFAE